MNSGLLDIRQVTAPGEVSPGLRRELVDCWVEVTNAGGAAGFPFPPIDEEQAGAALEALVAGLDPATSRLLVAMAPTSPASPTPPASPAASPTPPAPCGSVAGWLSVRRDPYALIAHWGTLHHVQTRTSLRGRGIGAALLREVRVVARDSMGLEQLRLAARGGVGLEDFYGCLGWRETGRWPGALRLAPGDDRDEVLMTLAPL